MPSPVSRRPVGQMTEAQMRRCVDALRAIATNFTTAQLRRKAAQEYGLPYSEVLEMTYENIQQLARLALRGIKRPKNPEEPPQAH